MTEKLNPYAPPKFEGLAASSDVAGIRQTHLRTESNVKAVGVLCLVHGILLLLYMTVLVWDGVKKGGGIYLGWAWAFPVLLIGAGIGLGFLWRWAWVAASVAYGYFLLADLFRLPEGMVRLLIEIVLLQYLLRSRTRRVVSKGYAGIRLATPGLRSPVARWAWWASGLLLLVMATYFQKFFAPAA